MPKAASLVPARLCYPNERPSTPRLPAQEETTTHIWPTVLEKVHKEEVTKMLKETNGLSRRATAPGLCLKRGGCHKWAGELQGDHCPPEQGVTSSSRQSRTRSEFGSHNEHAAACE